MASYATPYVYPFGGNPPTPASTSIAALSTHQGPFIFDPLGGVSVTGNETTMLQPLQKGQQYANLLVQDSSQFPDEPGYIVLAFGTGQQVGPIRYLGRLSSTGLALDFNFRFPISVAPKHTATITAGGGAASTVITISPAVPFPGLAQGTVMVVSGGAFDPEAVTLSFNAAPGATTVTIMPGLAHGGRTSIALDPPKATLLSQQGPFLPEHPQEEGAFYLTASPAGRVAAVTTINDITAAGIPLELSITYPGDRGLGAAGYPTHGNYKLSDVVMMFAGDSFVAELAEDRVD